MPCPFCDLIPAIRAGQEECVAELAESVVILAHDQLYAGYCIVVLKDHQEHLAQLPSPRQARIWNDVARVATAVAQAMQPARMNYECLGNMVNHIHWHIVPRYADDPRKHEPIWLRPEAERRGNMSTDRRSDVTARIRQALTAAK